MTAAAHVGVHLELAVEGDPIRGRALCGEHEERPFFGWLELAGVLEAVRASARGLRLDAPVPGERVRAGAVPELAGGARSTGTTGLVSGSDDGLPVAGGLRGDPEPTCVPDVAVHPRRASAPFGVPRDGRAR